LPFDLHVTELLKQCSQRVYLLRLLRNQGLSADQLSVVFTGLLYCTLCLLRECLHLLLMPVAVDALLKRAYKWSFSKDIVTFSELYISLAPHFFKNAFPITLSESTPTI